MLLEGERDTETELKEVALSVPLRVAVVLGLPPPAARDDETEGD